VRSALDCSQEITNTQFEIQILDRELNEMLDYRLHYAQMAAEDRLRKAHDNAVLNRGTKRVFQLIGRRSERAADAR